MADLDHLKAVEDALSVVLEDLRKRLGLTREQAVARLPGVAQERTLAAYERGHRRLSIGKFLELADGYGVSPVWLMREAYRAAGLPKGCPSCGQQR